MRRHPLGSQRAASCRQARVGLDKLLIERAERRLVGTKRRRGLRLAREQTPKRNCREQFP